MTVAVFPNLIKPETGAVLRRIRDFFAARGARIMLPRARAAEFGMEACGVDDIERLPADFALSLGGDGTLLGICRRYAANPVPVCGINMGTLGFMADIEQNELTALCRGLSCRVASLSRRLCHEAGRCGAFSRACHQ